MTMMELKVTPWPSDKQPTLEEIEQYFDEQELDTYYNWAGTANSTIDGHTHGYHKVLFVLEGNVKFEFPTRHETLHLNAGDRLELPAGIRHNAVVGVDGVVCVESHVY
jgi:quercetin dioxygenase-like cupin family protein